MIYPITPCPKPRMTQRDKWEKRPRVLRYRAFCDECRLRGVTLPTQGASIHFVLPMPKSWSKKKRAEMNGQPHQQKPDVSNLLKALEDAVLVDDSVVWHYAGMTKTWGEEGCIEILTNADHYECAGEPFDPEAFERMVRLSDDGMNP